MFKNSIKTIKYYLSNEFLFNKVTSIYYVIIVFFIMCLSNRFELHFRRTCKKHIATNKNKIQQLLLFKKNLCEYLLILFSSISSIIILSKTFEYIASKIPLLSNYKNKFNILNDLIRYVFLIIVITIPTYKFCLYYYDQEHKYNNFMDNYKIIEFFVKLGKIFIFICMCGRALLF
jgi:hypothetical protein